MLSGRFWAGMLSFGDGIDKTNGGQLERVDVGNWPDLAHFKDQIV